MCPHTVYVICWKKMVVADPNLRLQPSMGASVI